MIGPTSYSFLSMYANRKETDRDSDHFLGLLKS